MDITKKPSRKDLLRVVAHLQALIGDAMAHAGNDRDRDRAKHVQVALSEAHDLCIVARSFDPPER